MKVSIAHIQTAPVVKVQREWVVFFAFMLESA